MRKSDGDFRAAARLYTDAIIAAPIGSEELAFAHANRSLALMRLGYLESAYDDCLCALEEGYPVDKQYKIIIRQAKLMKDLGELVKLKEHISILETMKLEEFEIGEVENLKKSLSEMEVNEVASKREEISSDDGKPEKSFKIVKVEGQKQRSMIATKPIKKGDTIFIDRAFGFMCKTPGTQVCNNCAATMIVPFPCVACSGKIVYCSLKSKQDHAKVHVYECSIIQKFYDYNDMTMGLSLRMLLDGLPQLLPYLKKRRTLKHFGLNVLKTKK